jgi:hypothetical protein
MVKQIDHIIWIEPGSENDSNSTRKMKELHYLASWDDSVQMIQFNAKMDYENSEFLDLAILSQNLLMAVDYLRFGFDQQSLNSNS